MTCQLIQVLHPTQIKFIPYLWIFPILTMDGGVRSMDNPKIIEQRIICLAQKDGWEEHFVALEFLESSLR